MKVFFIQCALLAVSIDVFDYSVDRFRNKKNIMLDLLSCRQFKSKDLQVYEPET